MTKKPLLVVILLIVILLALLALVSKMRTSNAPSDTASTTTPLQKLKSGIEDKVVKYRCRGGISLTATYHFPDDILVDLDLSDGTKATLVHTVSNKGARYANEDETLIFQNNGTEASLVEDGVETYAACKADSIVNQ